jgi:hypothetical protein
MNTHTTANEDNTGQNQAAFSVQKRFGLSNVQALFANRQAFDKFDPIKKDFSRNASLEGLFKTDDGQKTVWVGVHQSYKDGFNNKNGFYNLGGEYQNPQWNIRSSGMIVQDNYFTDLGFNLRIDNYDAIRDTSIRLGFNQWESSIDYTIRPQEGKIQRHNFGIENTLTYNPDWSFNERNNRLSYFLRFQNTSEIAVRLTNDEVELQFPFSFVSDGEPLPADRYNYSSINFEYNSDGRKLFQYELSTRVGELYNGTIQQFMLGANYRVQPWGNFGIQYQYNNLVFPTPYGNGKITALLSKVEIGFTRDLIWTTLFQFVDQADFMGINSRLQWRFAPMSDLFLVYIDNYDFLPNMIETNNRAIALKINYWY